MCLYEDRTDRPHRAEASQKWRHVQTKTQLSFGRHCILSWFRCDSAWLSKCCNFTYSQMIKLRRNHLLSPRGWGHGLITGIYKQHMVREARLQCFTPMSQCWTRGSEIQHKHVGFEGRFNKRKQQNVTCKLIYSGSFPVSQTTSHVTHRHAVVYSLTETIESCYTPARSLKRCSVGVVAQTKTPWRFGLVGGGRALSENTSCQWTWTATATNYRFASSQLFKVY